MAKTYLAPLFVRLGNVLTTTLLRAGVKLVGHGNYPMYLLTLRGRKSGQPRTIPLVMHEQNGKRYLASRMESWIGCAICGQPEKPSSRVGVVLKRSTQENCRKREAALVLRADIKRNPFARSFGVTADSSLEEFERAAVSHPVFVLERK